MAFVKTRDGHSLLSYGKRKAGRHPLSLWRDDSLIPRLLEKNEHIFDIIMPWVQEKKEEEEKAAKKALPEKKPGKTQQQLAGFFSKKPIEPKKKVEETKQKKQEEPVDEEEELALLSKVVKSGCVEEFDWKYMDRDLSKKSEK